MADGSDGAQTRTSIDSLLELLRTKGKAELTGVSAQLGVATTIIEQWAKVLEEAKLIRVTYELGKMYMEPMNLNPEQIEDVKTKTAADKYMLDNQVELDRITLEKFYKNLESLSVNVDAMEQIYKQKLPQLHDMLSELDRMYTPIQQKLNMLVETRKSSETYLSQLDARMDALYAKVGVLNTGNVEGLISGKMAQLESAVQKATRAQESMKTLDDTKRTFYQQLEAEIDARTTEFKKSLKRSVDEIYANVKSETSDVTPLVASIKEQFRQAGKTASETKQVEGEVENIKRAVVTARTAFKDKYQKTIDEIEISGRLYEVKYEAVKKEVTAMRSGMGDAAKMGVFLKDTRTELAGIAAMIEEQKKDVEAIMMDLKAVDSAKNLPVEKKAQAIEEIKKRASTASTKTNTIRTALDKADKNIKGQKGRDGKG